MKSQLQEIIDKTSCRNCQFAQYKNNTQIGCSVDRLSKLKYIEAYDNEKEFYVIESLCNMYRGPSWNGESNPKQKAYSEIAASFDIFIDCNNINEYSKNLIDNFIGYILETYPKSNHKLNIMLFHGYISKDQKQYIIDILRKYLISVSIVYNVSDYLHNNIIKSKKIYHVLIQADSIIEKNSFNNINNILNNELKEFLVANYNNYNIISNIAYKFNYYNTQCINYYNNIENIITKSKEIDLYLDIKNEK